MAFTDNIGSILSVIDENGAKVFDASYDAWGRQTVTLNTIGLHRGYTGHEMLPEFDIINMNGRLYDPILGRFFSPDNYVQMPDNSQNFNRYSYCLNNPLKYTDPSGEIFGIDDAIVIIVGAAIIGGVTNLAANWDNSNGFWQCFTAFGVGAAGTGHVAGGTVGGLLQGNSLGESFANSFEGISASMVWGEVIGVTSTIATCYATKTSPWTGEKIQRHHSYPKFWEGSLIKS